MTNDTTQAIELDALHDEFPTETRPSRRSRRNRRRLAAAVAAGVVALGVGTTLALVGGTDDQVAGAPTTSTPAAAEPLAVAPAGDPAPTTDQPAGEPGEETPDPAPPAEPGHLVVSSTNIVLPTNDFGGSFELTNDGGSDVAWQWMSGHPAIATAPSGGVLAPGESVVVEFTVSWQQLSNGGFAYQNHVVSDAQSIKVIVSGTRDIEVNPDVELPEPEIFFDED
jgi:hypothetical protein